MSKNTANAPAWLFSFLDLAFLILIAVLITTDREDDLSLELATIELPQIEESSTVPLDAVAAVQWQVRIHERRAPDDDAAFSLVAQPSTEAESESRIVSSQLRFELLALSERDEAKPFLAPHRDSRSEDFLTALGAVQEVWPEAQLAAVRPVATTPSVAAGPGEVDRP